MTPAQPCISLADWQAAGHAFQWRGHEIFTRTAGPAEAPVLLLIHGFPTASWDWEALWPALAARWRVVTLDLLGFGFSAKPRPHAYSILEQADLCEALLCSMGVDRYHVLAHDYGDTVAQELLARAVEQGGSPRLESVALLNGGLFPETHRPLLVQKLLMSPLGPLLARLTHKRAFSANFHRIFGVATPPSPDLLDGFWTLLEHNGGRRVLPHVIRYMEERRRHRARWVGALQQAPVPVVFIDGAADPISGAHMAARYRELLPRPAVTLLEGIGHYPQCEAPAAVLAAYLAFRGSA